MDICTRNANGNDMEKCIWIYMIEKMYRTMQKIWWSNEEPMIYVKRIVVSVKEIMEKCIGLYK